jgi:CheY-like chemotaxis protein
MPKLDLSGRRFLVLEDEMLVAMLIEDCIGQAGGTVIGTTGRLDEAFSILARDEPDAAVLDINLGDGTTSYPVADALVARGIPLVFLSGYGASALRGDFRGRPFVNKPFRASDLVLVLLSVFRAGDGCSA